MPDLTNFPFHESLAHEPPADLLRRALTVFPVEFVTYALGQWARSSDCPPALASRLLLALELAQSAQSEGQVSSGPSYLYLRADDRVQEGDEYFVGSVGAWRRATNTYARVPHTVRMRRPIPPSPATYRVLTPWDYLEDGDEILRDDDRWMPVPSYRIHKSVRDAGPYTYRRLDNNWRRLSDDEILGPFDYYRGGTQTLYPVQVREHGQMVDGHGPCCRFFPMTRAIEPAVPSHRSAPGEDE